MDSNEILTSVVAARPGPDDTVYLQRRGQAYAWELIRPGEFVSPPLGGPDAPEVWLYRTGSWPVDDPDRLRAFFADLLAELESMAGGADRCRWPLDEPWPHTH